MVTTLGSVVHREHVSLPDSGVVRRLRAAGAIFTGKTNTAEFGQSATTENRLGPPTANPWDLRRTPGGSSGGAAASVAAGLSTVAIGSDGGGSIRIPAAFTGLFGIKPGVGVCADEEGFRAMTPFASPGPLAWRVADARAVLEVLAEHRLPVGQTPPRLRIGWCPRPEGRPVDEGVAAAVARAVSCLEALGHEVHETDLPVAGWAEIFGPLVLADEHRERGHLLQLAGEDLTDYERRSLLAARDLTPAQVERAYAEVPGFRQRLAALFEDVDVVVTPTTAVPAFPIDERPSEVDGQAVDRLWGAFPFAAPFNVAGLPAASVPCGLVDGLPAGVQLAGPARSEALLLELSENLESMLGFDHSPLHERWFGASGVNVA
jgi:aspartyl-tRNA(Asn)/glutamyl-tRNA(Gln) amidotransferase subunit A